MAYVAQYKKTKTGRRPEESFLQRRSTDEQELHGKMLKMKLKVAQSCLTLCDPMDYPVEVTNRFKGLDLIRVRE